MVTLIYGDAIEELKIKQKTRAHSRWVSRAYGGACTPLTNWLRMSVVFCERGIESRGDVFRRK